MRSVRFLPLLVLAIALFACQSKKEITKKIKDDHLIEITLLQINDVYEIAPLEGGKVGGMARLATLRKELLKENRNTFTVHAGDFLNPSLIGTIKHQGERIKGKQMVDVMNAVGIDLATFGNHEFDLKYDDLQKRLNESEFSWTSANCLHNTADGRFPFYCEKNGSKNLIPETFTYVAKDDDGTIIKIGLFSVTLPSNPKDYVHYEPYLEEAQKAFNSLTSNTDLVLGLTHLSIEQDIEVAKALPQVPLIMGGHEHDNILEQVGNSYIAKADANVKSAYIHRIKHNKKTKETTIDSELRIIDEKIQPDAEVEKVVNKWNDILMTNIKEIIEDPSAIIYSASTPLDGREKSVRNQQTNLGQAITKGMLMASSQGAVAAIQNGGSIRIDDQISGDITPIDIFRALPFGGSILDVEITGQLLKETLDFGRLKQGTGAFLQWGNISWQETTATWMINKAPLDPEKNYKIMMNEFLMRGLDIPFLNNENPGVLKITGPSKEKGDPKSDVRIALMDYLKTL